MRIHSILMICEHSNQHNKHNIHMTHSSEIYAVYSPTFNWSLYIILCIVKTSEIKMS